MRQRVHLLHHERRYDSILPLTRRYHLTTARSERKVPAGKAQDGQRRGHSLRHDLLGLRKLLGSPQDLPFTVPRGKLLDSLSPVVPLWRRHVSELLIDWCLETLLANQNKPAGSNQFNAAGSAAGGNPGAEGAQHQVLSGDAEMGDNDNTAFGYTVHNGNGTAEF
jgi:hypothetical protein